MEEIAFCSHKSESLEPQHDVMPDAQLVLHGIAPNGIRHFPLSDIDSLGSARDRDTRMGCFCGNVGCSTD